MTPQEKPANLSAPPVFKIARLAYLNTAPFFADGNQGTVAIASPRELGRLAAEGKIDAGPLSLADAWALEGEFENLGSLGIAVRRQANSVLLFSKRPLAQLNGAVVGVTDQTSTSVKLLKLVLEKYHNLTVTLKAGFSAADDARLLIGDEALRPPEKIAGEFPHVVDLGEEWHLWRGLPFVFARWMVRRTMPPHFKHELYERLDKSLQSFDKHRTVLSGGFARDWNLPAQRVQDYLASFNYRLGAAEAKAAEIFRDLVTGKGQAC